MKGIAHLFDVSSFVYTGMSPGATQYNTVKMQGFPVGGMKYFLRYMLAPLVRTGGEVAVFFDSKTDRKTKYSSYKSGRDHSPEIHAQVEELYDSLMRVGIPCYKVDGYEADDLIFSAVEQFKLTHSRVYIYSSDYDLTHNVDSTVQFFAANSNVNNVTLSNFDYSVVKGKKILPNTISAYKVFTGCDSDGVPSFISEGGISGEIYYDRFCKYLLDNLNPYSIAVSRDPRALKIFIYQEVKQELTEKDISDLTARIDVIYPRKAEMEFTTASKAEVDMVGLSKLLTICHEYQGLKLIRMPQYEVSEKEAEYFRTKARQLYTGEYAADRALKLEEFSVKSEALNVRSF